MTILTDQDIASFIRPSDQEIAREREGQMNQIRQFLQKICLLTPVNMQNFKNHDPDVRNLEAA